ncbi:MAG: hypothetical protein ACREER_06675, partial [Alphaproteobacteria bacterium]
MSGREAVFVVRKIGSVVNLIGLLWIGVALVGMVINVLDSGMLAGNVSEDDLVNMFGDVVGGVIPGAVLMFVGA